MKKKKFILNILSVCGLLALTGGISGCDENKNQSSGNGGGNGGTITPSLKSVDVEEKSVVLSTGGTYTLNYKYAPSTVTVTSEWKSSNEEVATVDENGVVTAVGEGHAAITVKLSDSKGHSYTDGAGIVVNNTDLSTLPAYATKTTFDSDINDLISHGGITSKSTFPNKGEGKILVIPVWFTDSGNYLNDTQKANVKDDLTKAYFGTNEETGWRSVKTFYEEESAGLVTVNGEVADWFVDDYASTYYYESGTRTSNLLNRAVNNYRVTHTAEEYSSFDADEDGVLDAVCLIYAAPDYSAMNNQIASNLWAYCSWNFGKGTHANPGINVFFWASYDFMYGSASDRNGKYYNGDTRYATLDTHTFIHEMGHIFGLEDYYDYNNLAKISGGFSMQDYNVGGHDPFSLITLGWANPIIPTESCEITIGDFQSTKDVILISPDTVSSSFDKYILLEYYTPTGLNEFDVQHKLNNAYPNGTKTKGIRAWLVDARLIEYKGDDLTKSFVNSITKDDYSYDYAFGNTTNSGEIVAHNGAACQKFYSLTYANYNQNQLLRNNYKETYVSTSYFSEDSLFLEGDVLTKSKLEGQFFDTETNNFYGNFDSFSIIVKEIGESTATIDFIKY